MPQIFRYRNTKSPDYVGGGANYHVLEKSVSRNLSDWDTGVFSVLASVNSSADIPLGSTHPDEPNLICTDRSTRSASGGSYIVTGQYKGIIGPPPGGSTIELFGEILTHYKKFYKAFIREESYSGDPPISTPAGPGGVWDHPTWPLRFNNVKLGYGIKWIHNALIEYPGIAPAALGSPNGGMTVPGAPSTAPSPWEVIAEPVRVMPYGWVLRNLEQEQIAYSQNLYMGSIDWIYEEAVQPG